MKKQSILALGLALTMTFGLVACGGNTAKETEASTASQAKDTKADETAASENSETGKKTWKIAVVPKDETNPWFVRMKSGVEKYATESGNEAFQKGPAETDAAQQIQVVEDLIAQGVDALCVVPHDPGAMEPVLKKAMDKGIVVITHEATSQENCNYDLEAFNYDEYGAYIMDTLAKAMGEEGKYITMVGSLTNDSHNIEADSAIKRQQEKYPNMTLIEEDKKVVTDDNGETAYQKAKEVLSKYPDLKGVVGTSSFDSPGVGRAIEEMGLVGKVFTVGTGMPASNKALLEADAVAALTLWDPADAGYAMCALAEKVLNGEEISNGCDLGIKGYDNLVLDGNVLSGQAWIEITKENVDSFGF